MGICSACADDCVGEQESTALLTSEVPDSTRQFVSGR